MHRARASRTLGAIAVFILSASAATAQDSGAARRLLTARCVRCTLDKGTQADWRGNRLTTKPTRFGTAGVLTFDAIDVKEGRARLIAGGVADVRVLLTPAGLTFLEETGTGNLIITTVFANPTPTDGQFVAVSSRHIATLTGPFPSQYHGTCTILE